MLDADERPRSASSWRRRCASCRSRACRATSSCRACSTACGNVHAAGAQAARRIPIAGPRRSMRPSRRRRAAADAAATPSRASGADRAIHVRWSSGPRVAVVLKGWPRLSETFIAQEIAGLEARGVDARDLVAAPADRSGAPSGARSRSTAAIVYLPEYLKDDPLRVLRGWLEGAPPARLCRARAPSSSPTCGAIRTPNRMRRLGQALVLAAELPAAIERLYAHFLHTPASVDALRRDHARPAVERVGARQGHLDQRRRGRSRASSPTAPGSSTCTRCRPAAPARAGARPERAAAGLSRPRPRPSAAAAARPARARDGSDPDDPVVILSVGRKVEKKGYDDLLDALPGCRADLQLALRAYRRRRAGRCARRRRPSALGIADRCVWLGAQPQKAGVRGLRARRPVRAGQQEGRATATRTACPTC